MKKTIGVYVEEEVIQELDELLELLKLRTGSQEPDMMLVKDLKRSDLIRSALDVGLHHLRKSIENTNQNLEAVRQRIEAKKR
jgi:hypothetical protein